MYEPPPGGFFMVIDNYGSINLRSIHRRSKKEKFNFDNYFNNSIYCGG